MPKLTHNTAAGDLSIGGVEMLCPAWTVLNLHVLQQPADQRGEDRLIPGANGVLALRRRNTVTRHGLQLLISGTHDRTGASVADRLEGLQANIDYLRTNVVEPTGSGDGTRSAVLTMPDGSARTEPVHVIGLEFGDLSLDGSWLRAVLTISIPSGRIQ
jgi:hypothetical protein